MSELLFSYLTFFSSVHPLSTNYLINIYLISIFFVPFVTCFLLSKTVEASYSPYMYLGVSTSAIYCNKIYVNLYSLAASDSVIYLALVNDCVTVFYHCDLKIMISPLIVYNSHILLSMLSILSI